MTQCLAMKNLTVMAAAGSDSLKAFHCCFKMFLFLV